MICSLQDKLAYLGRTINPNYIILIKHKASDNMDFSQFKVNRPEPKAIITNPQRFIVRQLISEEEPNKTHVIVFDNFECREVFNAFTKNEKVDEVIQKVKEIYRTKNKLAMI